MTVLDSSAAIDFLLGDGVASQVGEILLSDGPVAAPDLLVFEVVAVLRRDVNRGVVGAERARMAIEDLGDMSIELYGALPLRSRAWELRDNLTVADALFLALADLLDEPLATKDGGLAAAARSRGRIDVIELRAD